MEKWKKKRLLPSQKGMANTVGMFSTDPLASLVETPVDENVDTPRT